MCTKKEIELRVLMNTAAIKRDLRLQEVQKAIQSGDLHLISNRRCPDCSVDDAGPIDPSINLSELIAIY